MSDSQVLHGVAANPFVNQAPPNPTSIYFQQRSAPSKTLKGINKLQ
jgi:hypothetical protein